MDFDTILSVLPAHLEIDSLFDLCEQLRAGVLDPNDVNIQISGLNDSGQLSHTIDEDTLDTFSIALLGSPIANNKDQSGQLLITMPQETQLND